MRREARGRGVRVLIATDGSRSAQTAVGMASAFAWPRQTRLRGVTVVDPDWTDGRPPAVRDAWTRRFERIAAGCRRRLARRWPDAEALTVRGTTIEAILREARRFSANVIVLGWRGHGTFRRLLMGSVSRGVLERARCAVLIVRRTPRQVGRAVIGVEGSRNARRAVELTARLGGGGREISVVRVVEPVTVPTAGRLPPSVRATVHHQAALMNRKLERRARREVAAAAARLRRSGWRVRAGVTAGAPLATLLDTVDRTDAHLLIVGARVARGLRGALLGSVAAGAVNRSRVPVLVVR
jgi:nucleotide-binding universal stress UspA family protein